MSDQNDDSERSVRTVCKRVQSSNLVVLQPYIIKLIFPHTSDVRTCAALKSNYANVFTVVWRRSVNDVVAPEEIVPGLPVIRRRTNTKVREEIRATCGVVFVGVILEVLISESVDAWPDGEATLHGSISSKYTATAQ